MAASSLGVSFADTARVEVIVLPRQDDRPGELRSLNWSVAVQRLTGHCFDPVPLRRRDFQVLADLVRSTATFEWAHGPFSEFADTLRDLVDKV